jgi:hypothetical protein
MDRDYHALPALPEETRHIGATRTYSHEEVEAIARACHAANRAYCESIGDSSQPAWDDAPRWQKESAIRGVLAHLARPDGISPEESHRSWLAEKARTGWRYGPVKDAEAKTHPCFVPYDQLPEEQRAKDHIFADTVRALR